MKHLLIILISILLLSSPVIGQETGILYQWETSSNWVWKTFGDKNVNLKYEGEIKYGEPNGFGMSYHPNGSKYVGEFKGGRHDGRGTVIFSDGGKWVGEFRENEPWNITMYGKNGEILGKQINGKIVYKDKSVGVEGKRHNGVLYKLALLLGKWSRYGDEKKDGKYVGEIENGEPNGKGSYIMTNGIKYVGIWKDGEPNGQGIITSNGGMRYEGGWKNSEYHGQGTYISHDGEMRYEGEYKDGKKHGQGTHIHLKGHLKGIKYEGEYKDGKYHGQGTQHWIDGTKYVGEWKNGKKLNGIEYDKYGKIKYKMVNGKYFHPNN